MSNQSGKLQASQIEKMAYCLTVSKLIKTPGTDHGCLRTRILKQGYQASLTDLMPGDNRLPDQREKAEDLTAQGIWAMCAADPHYPYRLKQIRSCPLVLYVRGQGSCECWERPLAITVIGTRSPTAYGQAVTRRIVPELCSDHTVIISGLAQGIDGLAHQLTLAHDGMPLAVVAQGVDIAYPAANRQLMEEIAQRGLIISEHEPGTKPRRPYFPARNRILSGLADVVAVMEAASRSGTLITAGFAADQGRDVFAVPGSILMRTSEGCHQLLKEGAGVLTQSADLLPDNQKRTSSRSIDWIDTETTCILDQSERQLLQQLAGVHWTVESIADEFGWSIRKTESWLSRQELSGHLKFERGRFFLTDEVLFCI